MRHRVVSGSVRTSSVPGFPGCTLVVPTKRTMPRRGVSPLPPSTMTSVPTGTWSIDCTGMGGSGAREAARPAVAAMAGGGALRSRQGFHARAGTLVAAGGGGRGRDEARPTYQRRALSDPGHPDGAGTLAAAAPRTTSRCALGQRGASSSCRRRLRSPPHLLRMRRARSMPNLRPNPAHPARHLAKPSPRKRQAAFSVGVR